MTPKASREACNAVKVKLEAEWQEQEAAFEKDPDGAAAKWETRWTLDSVLAAVRDPAKGVKPAVLLPPASSMAVLRAAQEAPEAKPAGAAPSPPGLARRDLPPIGRWD